MSDQNQYDTTLLNGRVKMRQTDGGLRASTDSVLLAEKVIAKKGETILDLGCGSGAVGLCVDALLKDKNLHITGLDIQPDLIEFAHHNAALNHLTDRATYICGDVFNKDLFDAQAFDHIVMNPPYYRDGERIKSPNAMREAAFTGEFENWMRSALYWLKHNGSLTMIHRADYLDEILHCSRQKFGAVEVWPVYSKADRPAIRVIVKMIRNRKTPMTIHPGIIMAS